MFEYVPQKAGGWMQRPPSGGSAPDPSERVPVRVFVPSFVPFMELPVPV
jgi:hypothetical protein